MNHYSDEQILSFFKGVWKDSSRANIKVEKNLPDLVQVELESSYSPPGLGFAKLKAVSDFFGTTNIDDPDTFSYGGCETCDYGSSYGFTLVMRPNKEKSDE